jgi:SnoaL-like domain
VTSNEDMVTAVTRYFDVLNGCDPELLREVLADDFRDEDPLAEGASDLEGVIARVRLYRAALPDARSLVDSIVRIEGGALVSWTTSATGLDGSNARVACRYTAEMSMVGCKIRSHRVVSVERG